MSEQEAGEVWMKMPDSPFRKLIQYELEIAKLRSDAACATAPPDQILKQQGVSQGLQQALGILARKDPKSKN